VISLQQVSKQYAMPAGEFAALSDIDLEVGAGECVALVGKSGSGKSTLLNLIGGIDRPSSGSITVADTAIADLDETRLALWRGRTVGFVFQFFQLLPTLTVAENVMLPMDLRGAWPRRERRPRALALLERLRIADQADKLPAALSGGQQQRAAIARALANDPALIVADEPTGNLDSATALEVMGLLAALARDGKTVIVVTHERELGRFFTRTVTLRDGRVLADTAAPAASHAGSRAEAHV
jgi:putative ABC transport system ATP-binding protein